MLISQVMIISESLFKVHIFTKNCTKLHRFAPIFFKNFPENTTGPYNWGVGKRPAQTLPLRGYNVPLFRSFRGRCSQSHKCRSIQGTNRHDISRNSTSDDEYRMPSDEMLFPAYVTDPIFDPKFDAFISLP